MVEKKSVVKVISALVIIGLIIGLIIMFTSKKWLKVKKRKDGESDAAWSKRIFRVMRGNPSGWDGEGGVGHNANLLSGLGRLSKEKAISLCENPCAWGGNDGAPGCVCGDGSAGTGGHSSGVKGW